MRPEYKERKDRYTAVWLPLCPPPGYSSVPCSYQSQRPGPSAAALSVHHSDWTTWPAWTLCWHSENATETIVWATIYLGVFKTLSSQSASWVLVETSIVFKLYWFNTCANSPVPVSPSHAKHAPRSLHPLKTPCPPVLKRRPNGQWQGNTQTICNSRRVIRLMSVTTPSWGQRKL